MTPEIDKATPRDEPEVASGWLECPMCGLDKAFMINAMDASKGYCRFEDKVWVLKLKPSYDHLRSQNQKLREALREIEKGEGAFSLDHKQHAINTIENMKSIAHAALKEVE